MAQIVPSILEITKSAFLDTMSRELKLPGVERIQIDFGDGEFVPNTILPVTEIDSLNPAFSWEAHLMVKEPKDFLDYKIAGFNTILIHYEAFDNSRDLHEAIEMIKSENLKAGLVINSGTPVEVLKDYEKIVNHFQIMSVQPGFQGTPFLEESYERISHLRKLVPSAIIEVDGGVNFDNVKKIAQAGADLIIAGSVITKTQNMLEAYEKLIFRMSQG
jgi:ribulose-phosphate 3-epimerase